MKHETIRHRYGVSFLTFNSLSDGKLKHGFSLRAGGASPPPYDSLNLAFHVGDDPDAVRENRKRFSYALGYRPEDTVAGQQVHGTDVRFVNRNLRGKGHFSAADALPDTDGLICREQGIVLMAHSADCMILFFYDPVDCCIGLAHAGWRGTIAGIGPAMVRAMVMRGSLPGNIRVAISPAIGPCCYSVGEEIAARIRRSWRDKVTGRRGGRLFLDLPELQRLLLLESGIKESNIVKSSYCTCCHTDKFYSHRASGGVTGRMAGVISLVQPGKEDETKEAIYCNPG